MRFEGSPPYNPEEEILKEKTSEKLQAQAEVFADQGVPEFSADQARLLQYSAELAKIKDLDDLPRDLPEELVGLIRKYKESYVHFLRRERRLETSFIEQNIDGYKQKFQPAIATLKSRIAAGDPKELPEYLGSGSNGSAFRVEAGDRAYAAKFSRNSTQANFELKALLRAKGIPHTAQLENYSFEDSVVIMELLPGRNVTNFTPSDAPEYSDEQIVQLIETVRQLDARGLVIDPKASNFLYDPEQGFSVLDYHLKNEKSHYGPPQEIMDLRGALTARKLEKLDYQDPAYQEKAKVQSIERNKIYLPMMVRFLGILQDRYPEILRAWKSEREEAQQDPTIVVPDFIGREYIPEDPDLEPHLNKLEEMGF